MVEAVLFDCFNTLVTDAKGVYFAEKRQRAYLLLKKSRQNLSYEDFKDCWLQTFDAMTSVAKETLREFAMETFVAEVQKN